MRDPLLVLFAAALASVATACNATTMETSYPRSAVQQVTVQPHVDGQITLRYSVFPESSHYSGGVDYERAGDALRIVIARCTVGAQCEPMSRSVIPLGDDWQAEVHLPYDGGRVVIVHADGEQQVYP